MQPAVAALPVEQPRKYVKCSCKVGGGTSRVASIDYSIKVGEKRGHGTAEDVSGRRGGGAGGGSVAHKAGSNTEVQ